MNYYYGDKMPLRLLDEAEFWKHQESEHTVVIREFVPNLEQPYVDALKQWEAAFTQTHGTVLSYLESLIRSGSATPSFVQQVMQLIRFCLEQSRQFIQLLDQMLAGSNAIQANPTAPVVLKHIRRESEYFIGIAQTILYTPIS